RREEDSWSAGVQEPGGALGGARSPWCPNPPDRRVSRPSPDSRHPVEAHLEELGPLLAVARMLADLQPLAIGGDGRREANRRSRPWIGERPAEASRGIQLEGTLEEGSRAVGMEEESVRPGVPEDHPQRIVGADLSPIGTGSGPLSLEGQKLPLLPESHL